MVTEKLERLFAPPGERRERGARVGARVLPFFRPAIGVRGDEPRLVHRHDELHAVQERLLVVAQVTDHLFCRPALRVRTAGESGLAHVSQRLGKLGRRQRDPGQPLGAGTLRVLINGGHATPPTGHGSRSPSAG